MKRIFGCFGVVPLLASANAFAQSEAYDAGYKVGLMVAKALPYIGVALILLAAWFGYRAWRKRHSSRERQA